MSSLHALLNGSPYAGYTYSYPHKSAYRAFDPPISLQQVWAEELLDSLFLYLHVPFCEYRCGFCNLFTIANADDGWVQRYLSQLRAEADVVARMLPDAKFASVAIGGGTPTYLDEAGLSELIATANRLLGESVSSAPTSCEASPATLTSGKARLLRDWGVDRLSLGVQTFHDGEAKSLGRPQTMREIEQAIDVVRQTEFPVLNLDLIYGSSEQDFESWLRTVETAIRHQPEEVYLYPLYVRELTGLGRTGAAPRDDRLAHYRAGRDALLEAGYEQVSMRMFRKPIAAASDGPIYCCQSDGMVGLGCGARSYTRGLHYSSEFAVGRTGVRSILNGYLARSIESFGYAHHGYRLCEQEQKRRYLLQGLLQTEGVLYSAYESRFGARLVDDFPQVSSLQGFGLAQQHAACLQLTPLGLERSDAIGPWLYSPQVVERMEAFECV